MALATFDFKYFTTATQYPDEPSLPNFGSGWAASVPNPLPLQRKYNLNVMGMIYYQNVDNTFDVATNPLQNMGRLIQFYETHRMASKFIFPHPALGNINVRFAAPLIVPTALVGGTGALPDITITLIEDASP